MESRRETSVSTVLLTALLLSAYGFGAAESSEPASQAAPATQAAPEQHRPLPQGLTFEGDVALWTVAIKPAKTSDFEQVLAKVRDALQKSESPQRKQQAAGWRVMKMEKPLPDGNIAYVHIISPVVAGADYTILKAIYDEFPNESQQMYGLYRDAFAQNLAVAAGSVVIDMSKAQ